MLILIFEAFIACVLYSGLMFISSRNPENTLFTYPPAIVKRCQSLGIYVCDRTGWDFVLKKTLVLTVAGFFLGLLLIYANKAQSFLGGAVRAYLILLALDWFDAIVIDCMWFCQSKRFVISGTEDMVSEYHNYWYHIKCAIRGMFTIIPSAVAAGIIVSL